VVLITNPNALRCLEIRINANEHCGRGKACLALIATTTTTADATIANHNCETGAIRGEIRARQALPLRADMKFSTNLTTGGYI
jgi:hypothetical protein